MYVCVTKVSSLIILILLLVCPNVPWNNGTYWLFLQCSWVTSRRSRPLTSNCLRMQTEVAEVVCDGCLQPISAAVVAHSSAVPPHACRTSASLVQISLDGVSRQTDRQTHRQADKLTGRHRDRQADSQTDRLTDRLTNWQADTETDSLKDRQTHRQTDRQADSHTDRQTQRQTGKQAHR